MNVVADESIMIEHMIGSMKSATISQEASPITRNLNTHRLAVESRKLSQSLGMYLLICTYVCRYNRILTMMYVHVYSAKHNKR